MQKRDDQEWFKKKMIFDENPIREEEALKGNSSVRGWTGRDICKKSVGLNDGRNRSTSSPWARLRQIFEIW